MLLVTPCISISQKKFTSQCSYFFYLVEIFSDEQTDFVLNVLTFHRETDTNSRDSNCNFELIYSRFVDNQCVVMLRLPSIFVPATSHLYQHIQI